MKQISPEITVCGVQAEKGTKMLTRAFGTRFDSRASSRSNPARFGRVDSRGVVAPKNIYCREQPTSRSTVVLNTGARARHRITRENSVPSWYSKRLADNLVKDSRSSSSPFPCQLLQEEQEENKPRGIKNARRSQSMEMSAGEPISSPWGHAIPPPALLLTQQWVWGQRRDLCLQKLLGWYTGVALNAVSEV